MGLPSQCGRLNIEKGFSPAMAPQNLSLLWYLLYPTSKTQGNKLLLALPQVPPAISTSPFPHGSLTDFNTVTAVIIAVLAVSLWRTLETLALDDPSCAGTALGAASGDPGLASLQKAWKEMTGSEEGEVG